MPNSLCGSGFGQLHCKKHPGCETESDCKLCKSSWKAGYNKALKDCIEISKKHTQRPQLFIADVDKIRFADE